MKKNNKGFTLMEMLIVVAIIAILIAIMIPTFNAQLEKAREATDAANIRAAYAEAMVAYISDEFATAGYTSEKMVQTTAGWAHVTLPDYIQELLPDGAENDWDDIVKDYTVTFTIDSTEGSATKGEIIATINAA